MYTAGEAISNGARFYLNPGSEQYLLDAELRARSHFFLTQTCQTAWDAAPNWFKQGDGAITLTAGVGSVPNDFNSFGTHGRVFVSGIQQEVTYKPSDELFSLLVLSPSQGYPLYYTLADKDGLGVPKVYCWPTNGSTLLLKRYDRRMPELIDIPIAPAVELDETTGLLTGTYKYRVTFVTPTGETEGGVISDEVETALEQVSLSAIPVSEARSVTSRKIYRTVGGGLIYKLLTTLADNVTTTYQDNIADASLGANCPTPATATFTGLEVMPADFHESVIMTGLREACAGSAGDPREASYTDQWMRKMRSVWRNQSPGQNQAQIMPVYGAMGGQDFDGPDFWRTRFQ